jgi:hypothetical protein
MPRPDPVPTPRATALRRFARTMRWMATLSIACVAIAVGLVSLGDSEWHINMMIATALGVGFTVLLATALISLAYLSDASGHDEQAHHPPKDIDE